MEGKTMLVSGLGSIGTEVARRAHGLGMKVIATRVGGSGKPDFVDYVGQPDELLKLARTADVIVSCVPLTNETRGLYDKEFFAALKPTAYFINVARGPSVVTDELVKALNEGRLAGAGLDVTDPEPLPSSHPLWKAPGILITPHISAQSDSPGEARWTVAVENLRRYVSNGKMLNVVDIERGY
jgi:phosphoglycerate dehydrogenase-like enzyme